MDSDGDGYGDGCELGPDCDDARLNINPGSIETCDTVDNDCDSRVDEGYGLGTPCLVVYENCQTYGERVCSADATVECRPSENSSDLCDTIDNDCDGIIDESDPSVGTQCDAVGQAGSCTQGAVTCSAGNLVCGPGDSQPETCDAIDNDCDGQIDEGTLEVACRPDVPLEGECNPGTFACTGNEAALWGPCVDYAGPQTEICDALDNDCDGQIDELAGGCECLSGDTEDDCYTGPPGTLNVGTCVAGVTRACVYNMSEDSWDWDTCNDTPPTIELCDGLDNDCDGTTDEDLDLGDPCTIGEGACASDGVIACDNGAPTCNAAPIAPQAEACNGTDDDCDGRVDETNAAACTTGTGECAREGVDICDAVAMAIVCSVQPGQPQAEICDGLDNDCDGNTDEDLDLGDACTVGQGACARDGVVACDANSAATCDATAGGPTDETCDAIDNDCDGTTDESFGLGNACDGVGQCGGGVRECDPDGGVRCSSSAGGSEYVEVNETCDGLDNDCDDAIDEVWQLGEFCYGSCGNGVLECSVAGFAQCSTSAGGSQYAPVAETCNGEDDDCDGDPDEGFNKWASCGVGQCLGGSIQCDDVGGARCSTGPGGSNDQSAAETCDGSDNDCDGTTDEDFNVGDACTGVGECGAGVFECADAATSRCSTDVGGTADGSVAEVCDGTDDEDCDGNVDEGCP